MKRALIVVGLVLLLASAALADQVQVGYPGSFYGPYQTGVGGEFTLTPLNPTGWLDLSNYASAARVGGGFQTFCLEGSEFIGGYSSTYNASMNRNAVWGGIGPSGDPLSVGTGWLYSQFATSDWESGYGLSYNYTSVSGRRADADLFQKAIWWLEGEESVSYNASNKFMAAVVARFGSRTAAKADGGWLYGVYALNLTTANGGRVQDQLYFSGIPVPDGGATIALLGLAIAGLGIMSRRFRI